MKYVVASATLFLLLPVISFALTFNRPLVVGSAGADVTSLQQILGQQGFLTTAPTGFFGPLTAAALAQLRSGVAGNACRACADTTVKKSEEIKERPR